MKSHLTAAVILISLWSSSGFAQITSAATTSNSTGQSAAMINGLMSAAMMTACTTSTPPNMTLCMMGALAAMQAVQDSSAASQAANTASSSSNDSSTTPSPTPTPSDLNNPITTPSTDPSVTPSAVNPSAVAEDKGSGAAILNNPAVAKGMNLLSSQGYQVSSDGITNPDGSVTPASAFSSPASMTAAGLDGATAAKVLRQIQASVQAQAKAHVIAMGTSDGGGGGWSSAPEFDLPDTSGRTPSAIPKNFAAGKKVLYAGEMIGVAGDDIFEIMHRIYSKKALARDFIEGGRRMTP